MYGQVRALVKTDVVGGHRRVRSAAGCEPCTDCRRLLAWAAGSELVPPAARAVGTLLRPNEARHVGETVTGVDGVRELDEPAGVIVVAADGAERRAAVEGTEQLRLALAEPHRLDALLDPPDADAV